MRINVAFVRRSTLLIAEAIGAGEGNRNPSSWMATTCSTFELRLHWGAFLPTALPRRTRSAIRRRAIAPNPASIRVRNPYSTCPPASRPRTTPSYEPRSSERRGGIEPQSTGWKPGRRPSTDLSASPFGVEPTARIELAHPAYHAGAPPSVLRGRLVEAGELESPLLGCGPSVLPIGRRSHEWTRPGSNRHSHAASVVSSRWTSSRWTTTPFAGAEGIGPSRRWTWKPPGNHRLAPMAPRTGIEPVSPRRQRGCDTSRITRHSESPAGIEPA